MRGFIVKDLYLLEGLVKQTIKLLIMLLGFIIGRFVLLCSLLYWEG